MKVKKMKYESLNKSNDFKEDVDSDTSIMFTRTRTKLKNDKSTRNIPFSLNQLEEEGVDEEDMFVFSKMRKLKNLFNACKKEC